MEGETEGEGERDPYKQSYYKESKKTNDISSKLRLNLKAKHLNPNSQAGRKKLGATRHTVGGSSPSCLNFWFC